MAHLQLREPLLQLREQLMAEHVWNGAQCEDGCKNHKCLIQVHSKLATVVVKELKSNET